MLRVVAQRMQGRRVSVQINGRGQLVGRNAAEMQSFIGVVTQQTIPLAIWTWPTVPRELKNKIWEQIQAAYDLDPRMKKAILSSAGEKWRQFKSTLTVDEILPNKDNLAMLRRPPKAYNFISQKDWESFVAIRLSAKYMKMHDEIVARVREKKYQYRLGRKGYTNTEAKIKHELWKIAHRKKNGEYANDVVREITEKIDEIAHQHKEGSVTFRGANDILTVALGLEHPCSVRAKGKGAVPTSYLYLPRRIGGKDGIVKIMLEEQRKLLENERSDRNEEKKIYAQQISVLQDEIRAMSTQ
ncbi:hypothetical protein UlMin_029293 [Ulmus minor]